MDDKNGVFSGGNEIHEQYAQPMPPLQPTQQEHQFTNKQEQPQKPKKSPSTAGKIFGGIALSFIIMGLFMGVQLVTAFVFMIVLAVQYTIEMSGDTAYVMQMMDGALQEPEIMTQLTVIATAVSAVIAVFFYWLILGRKKTESDKLYYKEKVLKGRNFLMITIATVGLYFLAILISNVVAAIIPETAKAYNEMMEMALGGNMVIAALASVLLAPISEECIMRGLVFQNLRRYFTVPAAIIIQAVMFGIFHMNWIQGLYVLPVGIALGFVAAKSKSVLPCIYMHMLHNFMAIVVAILPEVCQSALFCIAATAVCGVAVWLMHKNAEDSYSNFLS